jgi:hypothetical protein
MAFGSGERLGKMLSDEVAGETWPGGEETGVNGFGPSRWDWAAGRLVVVLDNVPLLLQFVDVVGSLALDGTHYDTLYGTRDRRRCWAEH